MRRWFEDNGLSGVMLIVGFLVSLGGGIATLVFLEEIDRGGRIPPGQLFRQLIVPHITLLLGLGIMLGAFIFMMRRRVIAKRLADPEV